MKTTLTLAIGSTFHAIFPGENMDLKMLDCKLTFLHDFNLVSLIGYLFTIGTKIQITLNSIIKNRMLFSMEYKRFSPQKFSCRNLLHMQVYVFINSTEFSGK